MTDFVQWDSIPQNSGDGGSNDYLRLKSGNNYKIRPIFSPVKFFKYFHRKDGRVRTAICADPNTCPVRDKHPELKKPSLRFAAYVIDRADNRVKILEAPQSVFRPIGSSLEMTGKDPGSSKEGSDWGVKVTGKGLNTKYDVMFIKNTPFTKDERAAIKEAFDGDKEKLKKKYVADTPDQIEEKLFGDWANKNKSSDFNNSDNSDNSGDSDNSDNSDNSDDSDDFDNNW